jgi:3-phenylpropionate/trans-cinnamate dioxygenase ferredoxin reductase subunit
MVIVGAGHAGAGAALELRKAGWPGDITLIGEENCLPYERPPLSKESFSANGPAHVPLLTESDCPEKKIRLLNGLEALSVDRSKHRIALSDGRSILYERLLLATGSVPRQLLQLPGSGGVHYLRRLDQASALNRLLTPGMRLTVIGGGFIGLEVAASARNRGIEVTLLEGARRLLSRCVPPDCAESIKVLHEQHGVEFRMEAAIAAVEQRNGTSVVALGSGERFQTDCIIAGIGAVPQTRLAESAGLALDNGVAVDACLRTDDPDIFAAGDCCSFPHAIFGGRRIRLEAWRNARDQAEIAAVNMLGGAVSYVAVPWFWSDQYDQTLQIAGLVEEGRTVISRDTSEGTLSFYLAEDGRLVAASALGLNSRIAKDIRISEMLISRSAYPPASLLASTDVPLKTLLA